MKFDIEKVFDAGEITEEVKESINSLEFPENTNMVTIMENTTDKHIKVTSYFQNWEMPSFGNSQPNENNEELKKFTELMNTAPQLEGVIDHKGNITSFYLEQKQKNLIALMHQLPNKPVSVGDSWEINMNCLQMGVGFSADSAKKINKVVLSDIKIDNEGNKIAILDYMLTEQVHGTALNPMKMERSEFKMSCSYIGRHQFDLKKGLWKSINGEMAILSSGVMESKLQQHISMFQIDELPSTIKHKK
ncbi:hypothetical protein [Desulfopila inferna]|uniref:hypothetical protein n=1 Tax=Desulfopila inferna TaxID=468528 RepID=UPI00196682C1|nr:hypothetical protein [Desulfopila inferna]MBM9606241.1 hypothetical protein [Desulfopila inferna]